MITRTDRRNHWLPFGLLILFILGCGGSPIQVASGWAIGTGNLVTVQSGGTASLLLQATQTGGTHLITVSASTPANMLITPSPRTFTLSDTNTTQSVAIEVVVNGVVPAGDYTFELTFTSATNEVVNREITVRVTTTSVTTGIVKLTDFTPDADGVWVSRFRIENGAPGVLFGALSNPPFDLGYRTWYRPDSRLVIGEGQTQEFEIVAALRDTMEAEGSTDFTIGFTKGLTPYSFMSNIPYMNPAGRQFRLQTVDGTMRPLVAQGDNAAEFTFELTPDAGITGNYSVTIAELDSSVSATVSPASVMLDGSGTMVSFTVTINRIGDDVDHIDDQPYEPVLVGTNDAGAAADVRQRFFIDVVK